MSKWVPILKVLANPKDYGDIRTKYIDYVPDFEELKFSKRETGCEGTQIVRSERRLLWNPFLDNKGNACLISSETTSYLRLKSKIGYLNAAKLMKKYSSIYGCKGLLSKGYPITTDILDILHKEVLKGSTGHWIYIDENIDSDKPKVAYAISSFYDGVSIIYAFCSDDFNCSFKFRPIVRLNPHTLIGLDDPIFDGSSSSRALRIKLSNQREAIEEEINGYKEIIKSLEAMLRRKTN